ncbi:MAG: 50S ribosomal protein L23 [bacterium]
MAILDIFKKKKKESVKAEVNKAVKEKPPKMEEADVKKQTLDEALQAPQKQVISGRARKVEKKQFPDAYRILESPHVTEKSGMLSEHNSYVFKVNSSANKHEIKKAVQDLYGVAVEGVTVVNIPRKARRLGRSQGFKPGFKKAMVKLAEGEKIEIMPR